MTEDMAQNKSFIDSLTDPFAKGLTGIVFDVVKKTGGNLFKVIGDKRIIAEASKNYSDKYKTRYGKLQLLGMQQAVLLESVYIAVQFLDELSIRRFESVDALEETYRESQKRRFQTMKRRNQDGITVVNENKYLMVLGGPGTGKSTFLRRMGLEALKGKEGKLKYDCIPVFLELKQFTTNEIDLRKSIAEEFKNFGFPPTEEFATKALEQGRLLILLDGLDEVPSEQRDLVINSIRDFVNRYDGNYFITSCRIAAYRSNLERFTPVELADFDDAQIYQFIQNWFQSELDKQSATSEKCWETLNEPNYAAIKELAQTPLLLTLLCLVYSHSQSFPTQRSSLYRKALDIFLEEWAAEKRVKQDKIYQGLNPELEKVLLSEIAYHGFIEDRLFFTQEELVDKIKDFLSDTVDKPKYLDGKAVLEAITIQQGILVERSEYIFSFSHLTLQEYLTAQYISQDYREIEKLVAEHLREPRWREVFLLVAGLVRNADELLELMETESQKYINTPKLQNLLVWADQATADSEGDFKRTAKRAAALALTFALVFTCTRDREFAFARDRSITFACECDNVFAHKGNNIFDLLRTLAFDNFYSCKRALNLINEFKELQIFNNSLIAKLEVVRAKTQGRNQPPEVHEEAWMDALKVYQYCELLQEEAKVLADYLYAQELIVRCQKSAVRVSKKNWTAIEERLLLT